MSIFSASDLLWWRRKADPSGLVTTPPRRLPWTTWLGVGLWLAALGIAGWFSTRWPSWLFWGVWGGLSVTLLAVLVRNVDQVFGPVLTYDLIRTTRRGRTVGLRCLYGLLLALIIYLSYGAMLEQYTRGSASMFNNAAVPREAVAEFAANFFMVFLILQLALVVLLAPFYTASAITEEKERKTLEYLFATDLANHEIILGKLAARGGNVVLLLLTGLPVLAALQFLGGVDPNQLLAGFAGTVLMLLSMTSFALLVSVYNRSTWDAVFRTYLVLFFYAVFSLAGAGVLAAVFRHPFNLGNPMMVVVHTEAASYRTSWSGASTQDGFLWEQLGEFAVWHLLIAAVCCGWAIWRLRRVALTEASRPADADKVVPIAELTEIARARPPVSDRALLWKEMYAEPDLRWKRGLPLLDGLFLFGLFALGAGIPAAMFLSGEFRPQNVNVLVRSLGTIVGGFLLLLVGINAASRVSRERERQTLDSLLTAPIETDAILLAKWVASVRSVRLFGWLFVWLCAVGVLGGGLHLLALPLLLGGWLVHAACCALIGLTYSTLCGSTLRATILAIGTIFLLMIGPWVVGPWLIPAIVQKVTPGSARFAEDLVIFQGLALSPPGGLCGLAFYSGDFRSLGDWRAAGAYLVPPALCGVLLYGLVTAALWLFLRSRFQTLAGRDPFAQLAAPTPPKKPLVVGPSTR